VTSTTPWQLGGPITVESFTMTRFDQPASELEHVLFNAEKDQQCQ